ncbi:MULTISPECIES: RidA family protein [Rhodococcus]|uniref:RidA family protein n=1 Tax=Rhodococcus oxybenzonivorans TaxID=1990687 RepID=A0AAE4V522_9NOCA|nr:MULTISPECIES: RidA family protein [Rhodococcus]MDV7242281.1 RidA family protein [Rhodococcus oxybenzonivorans]MDV7268008.1 RidA family protein [Rhodococcus oxybenzonivorans]MDV7276224.1 RidA family protein [Rhodococcus oxybenzonivorans]MDV7331769.1 RidA family protein [Rhodococcus oxybenzonivorans]MDV7343991.1 RidA family protein [Rhodococcus oxybenzonivorans]
MSELESVPTAPRPQGRYISAVVHDGIAYSAGMTPRRDGVLTVTGVVGRDLDIPLAREAAALAARNAIDAVAAAVGGTAAISRCLRMSVFVACAPDFRELSAVADGASDVLVDYLELDALPVRSAIGVYALPSGAPVEIELTVAVASPADSCEDPREV